MFKWFSITEVHEIDFCLWAIWFNKLFLLICCFQTIFYSWFWYSWSVNYLHQIV